MTGGEAIVDPVLAGHLGCHRGRERRLLLVVHGHGIIALVGELRRGAVELRRSRHDLVQTLLQQVADLGREAARRAAQERCLRNDVVGIAGLKHADRDHRRLQRIDVARHDRLDLIDDLRAHQHRVDARYAAARRARRGPRFRW